MSFSDDGRWLVGVFGFGMLAQGAVRGSKSEVSEAQRVRRAAKKRWSRWSDELWGEVVSGPAEKIFDKQLQAVYYVLTADFIGRGLLEDASVRRLWLEVVPSSDVTEDSMVRAFKILREATPVDLHVLQSARSVPQIFSLAQRSKSADVGSGGVLFLDFPDWQFLPGMIGVLPDGSLFVERRGGGSSYVVRFVQGKPFYEASSSRPSGASRGTCPSSFMEQAREQGQVFAFACGQGVSAASFLTSRRLLVIR